MWTVADTQTQHIHTTHRQLFIHNSPRRLRSHQAQDIFTCVSCHEFLWHSGSPVLVPISSLVSSTRYSLPLLLLLLPFLLLFYLRYIQPLEKNRPFFIWAFFCLHVHYSETRMTVRMTGGEEPNLGIAGELGRKLEATVAASPPFFHFHCRRCI